MGLADATPSDQVAAQREAGLDIILEQMDQGLTVFDAEARLVAWNQRYVDLFELPPEAVYQGVRLADLIAVTDLETTTVGLSSDYDEMVREILKTVHQGETVEAGAWLKNGRYISARQTAMPDGGWVATYTDMTKRARFEEKIKHASEHDSMTGLINRSKFSTEYKRLVAQGGPVVAMLVDIDHFKSVNDTFGHGAGDAVIMGVAERLKECVREGDIIARLGGDEFAVLLSLGEQTDTKQAHRVAQSVIDRMRKQLLFQSTAIDFSVSVGAYEIPANGENLDISLSRADYALYRAKQDGRGKFQFFDAKLARELERSKLFSSLVTKETFEDKLTVHFQPIVCLDEDRDCSYEALIRWAPKDTDYLSPIEIIGAAEQNGAILSLGDWVLNYALRVHKSWGTGARIAVNLSPRQLGNGLVVAQVKQALEHHNVAPSCLELEVTETAVLQDDASFKELHDLKELGVQINLDDFGTGYSSLTLLQSFPFDKLKIDRSFISRSDKDASSNAIVRSIVSLAHELSLETVAEGIETQLHLDSMTKLGCALGQGYFLGRPVDETQIIKRAQSGRRDARKAA